MGVLVSRIKTKFNSESVQEMFASFTIIMYVSEKEERIYLAQS